MQYLPAKVVYIAKLLYAVVAMVWYGMGWYGMGWDGIVCYANEFSWLWKPVCLLWLAGYLAGWLAVCLSALAGWPSVWLPGWLAGCLFVSSRRFQQPTKSNDLQTVPMA